MIKKILCVLAMVTLIAPVMVQAAPSSGRERIRIDSGWRFHLGDPDNFDDISIAKWGWKVAEGRDQAALEGMLSELSGFANWPEAVPGQDVFHGRRGFAWFRAALPAMAGPNRILHFESVDDNATVFVNGKKLLHHEGWNEPFDVPLDSVWKEGGENSVLVLAQNTDGAGGMGVATLQKQTDYAKSGLAAVDFDDRIWRTVHLPHDFVVEGTFTPKGDAGHGSLITGVGWYRKTFDVPVSDKGRRLWLDFDGVYRNSNVWMNGHLLGNHKSGYTGFRYDISDVANYGGRNTLVVRADARAQEGWWYEGGGIYRHVWLSKAAPLHIAPEGVFVSPEIRGTDSAAVKFTITLANQAEQAVSGHITTEVQDAEGRTLGTFAADLNLVGKDTGTVQGTIALSHARLWSIEAPYLYRLVTRIVKDGKELDRVTTHFGVRTVRFDAQKGLFINEKPVKIKGTCNHQDHAGMGIALPDSLLEWRIKKLKEMGSNAYRCSHNPPAAELLDACDRLGMIVMDENRHLGDTYRDHTPSGTPYSDLSDLKDLIRRDRNHPSVIMWSMCNEEGLQGSPEGARIFAAMKKVVNELDPTRPVTCAMNGGWGQGISRIEHLQGCNYNPGGYDDFHRRFPDIPMYGSETASEVGTRGEYVNDPVKGYVSAYSVNAPSWAQTCEVAWKALAERDFMAGGFVWTGFDYKGEPTPYGWPCINSHFGIMDICGFPKDAYYYYQSWWGDKDVVHLLPHWNWAGKERQPIDVWCHSNAEKVELFLNGQSLGTKEMPRFGHLQWQVPYAPGKLEAKGYRGDKVVVTDSVETTGAPTQLRLTPDRKVMTADGEEVIMVAVSLLDAQGRVVPFAENEVTFAATGAGQVAGVGNGDPSSHEPDKATQRKAFHGLCMAIVQAGERPGTITLTASTPGLKSARVTLQAKK